MTSTIDRNFLRPLSEKGPYRFNPHRQLPPRILATPRFHAMLSGILPVPAEFRDSFQECLEKLRSLFPIVQCGFMEGGHFLRGGFFIHTIWSSLPTVADVVFVRGSGDTGYFGLPYLYDKTRDESLLADLIPILVENPD